MIMIYNGQVGTGEDKSSPRDTSCKKLVRKTVKPLYTTAAWNQFLKAWKRDKWVHSKNIREEGGKQVELWRKESREVIEVGLSQA